VLVVVARIRSGLAGFAGAAGAGAGAGVAGLDAGAGAGVLAQAATNKTMVINIAAKR
jgi:hypothetical protein